MARLAVVCFFNDSNALYTFVLLRIIVNEYKLKERKRHHHNHGNHSSTSTSYYIHFRVESGDVMCLKVKRSDYHIIDEGMTGEVTFQGTRYLGFLESDQS